MVEILFFEEAYKIFEKYSIMAITSILEFNYIAFLQRTLIQLFLLYGKTMTFGIYFLRQLQSINEKETGFRIRMAVYIGSYMC
jgi:hypothetical protein